MLSEASLKVEIARAKAAFFTSDSYFSERYIDVIYFGMIQSPSSTNPSRFVSGSLLAVYCYSCETAICTLCASIEHRGHWTVAMAEAIEDEKETLRKLIDDAYVQVTYLVTDKKDDGL